ncbi:aldo/keto reductase [Mucilaginibacter phyllosphaerae]|uniref:Aldo/keto reductase n=1 Tax=Mucilaginibacter phyllosphaerae TaxID=1812349 RepID=A0A4Y8AKI4_9SPHI|nr:aldo/keto reductase [Mucilaginibacter phyllosphaerae]MBB3967943.1 aryl-alcohol dehydrogenase-like predicted oxidoreductase [Mucilaginibacter phyllosphaerae]TEW69019.1 aldo/keto reductase [Mucilaginibacter phyllosphaerae]GGH02280.1 oxidoreductase [Mucilaginibacter phyllosphaerae]
MSNETKTFQKTFSIGGDLEVNRLGYGAMRITGKGIWGPPKDHDEAIRVLKRAVELGVNFIDTADSYGPYISEELIAEALYPYPADLIIGTKGGLLRTGPDQWPVNASAAHLKEALEGSLKRLKQDQIDLYQLHRIDPNIPAKQTFEFLKQAQADGKIRHIGLSEVDMDDIKKAQDYFEVVSVQNMYSVDNRKWEGVLNYCEDNDIAFIPWYPLNAGNVAAQEKLKHIAEKHSATVHQVALSWLLNHSKNILLIPGTSSVAHLEENIKTAGITLDDVDMNELDGISPPVG